MNIQTTVIVAFLLSSLVEYCFHRFYFHYFQKDGFAQKHHRQFSGKTSFEVPDARLQDIMPSYMYLFIKASLYYILSVIWFIDNISQGILFFATTLIYALWTEYIHLHFHKPDGKAIENLRIFKFLKENHRKHHMDNTIYYGIGSHIWDILFRTDKERSA
ncbi:fatty acid hydroxylase superfamily protein [Oxobacter pfennigii]|uniref:Fatty acid hydroxylase superfamily protein n=1 Tax=Oxobacter pfennigii TaxID=36849 RepID=A0A0P8W6G0_9CLOT|nr:sterol desaturase family protein [Oxobacter pfennigii]KPU43318.1 fatty acid hydroxylase superfamily protein [Oxobacter pfennigii]